MGKNETFNLVEILEKYWVFLRDETPIFINGSSKDFERYFRSLVGKQKNETPSTISRLINNPNYLEFHFKLPIEHMTQKYTSKIVKQLNEFGEVESCQRGKEKLFLKYVINKN